MAAAFYTRDAGIPIQWVARMRESMARLTPRFSAKRAVREYTGRHYLPAAARSAEQGARLAAWHQALERHWPQLGFGSVNVVTVGDQHGFEVQVRLGELDPDAVRVELYADGIGGGPPVCQELKRVGPVAGSNSHGYRGAVPAARPATDYTARVVPCQPGVAVPLEDAHILWQR